MANFTPSARISIGLVGMAAAVFLVALICRLVPEDQSVQRDGRAALCEQLATQCGLTAAKGDLSGLKDLVHTTARGNPEILSAGVRHRSGELLVEFGEHRAPQASDGHSDDYQVPVTVGGGTWGVLEVRFQPLSPHGLFRHSLVPFVAFFGVACFLSLFLYFRFISRPLPVTPHSDADLDLLAGDEMLCDHEEQKLFTEEMLSRDARPSDDLAARAAARSGEVPAESAWSADPDEVKTTPIIALPPGDKTDSLRETAAAQGNLTVIEKKNAHLKKLLLKLQRSRAEIQRQNQQLRDLATKDPLTGCLNRWAFFTEFEMHWGACRRGGKPLSCVMLDVDHFKSINDSHGHSVGDRVLQGLAAILRTKIRHCDFICRYGGEEFCLLMPEVDIDEAALAAERLRQEIAAWECDGIRVTASLGVSALSLGAKNMQELLDQADRALYRAKRDGRDRVVRWDEGLLDNIPKAEMVRPARRSAMSGSISIPFHAVTALLSALGYRHAPTAEHSRRVADLCVATANGLLSHNECYVLEVAALLHDVGKLGVPDAILLKPGPLSEEEWRIIKTHEAIGEEIIAASFSSTLLSDIIRYHHHKYEGEPDADGVPKGADLPLGARILAIADAYDAMTSDQVYRRGCSQQEAFAELRRCAGKQFDPLLVERFIQTVLDRDQNRSTAMPALPKQIALQIGLQLERLAIAADVQDRTTLIQTASSLHDMAIDQGIEPIAELAGRLKTSAQDGTEINKLTELTLGLIELCRSTYQAYLPTQDSCLPFLP